MTQVLFFLPVAGRRQEEKPGKRLRYTFRSENEDVSLALPRRLRRLLRLRRRRRRRRQRPRGEDREGPQDVRARGQARGQAEGALRGAAGRARREGVRRLQGQGEHLQLPAGGRTGNVGLVTHGCAFEIEVMYSVLYLT